VLFSLGDEATLGLGVGVSEWLTKQGGDMPWMGSKKFAIENWKESPREIL
jgi:hypothetical protein